MSVVYMANKDVREEMSKIKWYEMLLYSYHQNTLLFDQFVPSEKIVPDPP